MMTNLVGRTERSGVPGQLPELRRRLLDPAYQLIDNY
jgi:hypothetical protein